MSTLSISHADLDVLRTWKLLSGYRGVYPHRRGWRAYGKNRRKLGVYRTPREAATVVVRWWVEHYGPGWADQFARSRHQNLTHIRQTELGFVAFVWEEGRRKVVPCPDRKRVAFATREEARVYLRAWCRREYGLFVPVAVCRSVPVGGPYLKRA